MVGVGTFAILVGIASSGISDSVEGLRVSNEAVLERRHTVLLSALGLGAWVRQNWQK